MSHIVTIQTECRDRTAITGACKRLQLAQPEEGTFRLFSGQATGMAVRLPGWRYPVVCDTKSGTLHYDNYQGRWGKQGHLDAFLQAYAVEKSLVEARRKGYAATESRLADGSIKVTVRVVGGVA